MKALADETRLRIRTVTDHVREFEPMGYAAITDP